MPITITITDPTPAQIVALFGTTRSVGPEGPMEGGTTEVAEPANPARQPRKAKAKAEEPAPQSQEDAELAAEIARDIAEAPPEPAAATQVVDAGTGQPIPSVSLEELRANATRLAQKDTPALAALLKQFGAAKLSEVSSEQHAEFNAEIVAALG